MSKTFRPDDEVMATPFGDGVSHIPWVVEDCSGDIWAYCPNENTANLIAEAINKYLNDRPKPEEALDDNT